jgi:hypothetical protein
MDTPNPLYIPKNFTSLVGRLKDRPSNKDTFSFFCLGLYNRLNPDNIAPTAGIAQLVEQLICNQPVGGSSPFASLDAEVAQLVEHQPSKLRVASSSLVFRSTFGGMPEWLKGADCKSAGVRLRRFESYSHHTKAEC